MRVILLSFTPIDSSGGVPRWNRDVRAGLEAVGHEVLHFSWWDVEPALGGAFRNDAPEWDKATILGSWLRFRRIIRPDDVVLADGFWALGLRGFHPAARVVSVCHGNWSHTTKEDVDLGIPPEFPHHHRAQLDFRRRHVQDGGRLVAVSGFIAHQCRIQWGLDMPVINNGIDLDAYRPAGRKLGRVRPIVIHGTTTANKGFDHISAVGRLGIADVWLLDEAADNLALPKYEALAQADLVVHPSAHEGNSYFVLESLACGVPIVSYAVGLMHDIWAQRVPGWTGDIGIIVDRARRSPAMTSKAVRDALNLRDLYRPREFAELNSLRKFQEEWVNYVEAVHKG